MPRYFNVKGIVFSTNGAEAIELLHKKKETAILLYIIQKNELKIGS